MTGSSRFSFSYQSFYIPNFFSIYFTRFFIFQKGYSSFINGCGFIAFYSKFIIVIANKTCKTQCFIIGNGNISRSLIPNMYLVPLLVQSFKCATHTNNIIIWMRTKNNNTFFSWFCSFWSFTIVCIRFSTWPTCNGVLQFIKYFCRVLI